MPKCRLLVVGGRGSGEISRPRDVNRLPVGPVGLRHVGGHETGRSRVPCGADLSVQSVVFRTRWLPDRGTGVVLHANLWHGGVTPPTPLDGTAARANVAGVRGPDAGMVEWGHGRVAGGHEVTDERTSADVDRLLDDAEALTLKALYELPDEQIEQALDGLNRLILALRRMKIRRQEGKKGPEVELTHAELRVQLKETIEELRALGDTVTVVRTETDESVTIL